MLKTNTSRFKANLSKYLRAVRRGEEVLVSDRDMPIARVIPIERGLAERSEQPLIHEKDPLAPAPGQVVVKGIKFRGTDSTRDLRADRDRR